MSQFSKSGQFNKSGQFLVKPHNPRRTWIKRIAVLIVLVGIAWASYEAGQIHAGYRKAATSVRLDTQSEQLRMLNARLDELLLENAQLASNLTIDSTASKQVTERLRELNEEILELKEELVFYRSLLTPADLEPGVQILGMQLARNLAVEGENAEGDLYTYKVVLTQRRNPTESASGQMDLQITGLKAGRPATLYANDFVVDSKTALVFQFRNFHSLEGQLIIPKGFEPQNMLVSVMPKGRGMKQVERNFEWNTIVIGG